MNKKMSFVCDKIISNKLYIFFFAKFIFRSLSRFNSIKNLVSIFCLLLFVFDASSANAVVRKSRAQAPDASGYVERALAKDHDDDDGNAIETPSADPKTSKSSSDSKTTPVNKKPPAFKKKDSPSPVSSKKISKKASKKTEDVWLPEMGENPDTPEVVEKRQEEAIKEKKLLDDLLSLNYKTHIPPKELYGNLDEANKHLPRIYFQSSYLEMIYKAINNRDFNNLRTLLANYKFINQRQKNGDTLLIYAIQNNSLNSARILIAKGALVNALNDKSRTALHYAAALGYIDSLKLLLTMGANPTLKDDNDMTAMDYAQVAQQPMAEAILTQYLSQYNMDF